MTRYILRRLLAGAVTLLGITAVTFSVIRLAPGDPAELQALGAESPEVSAQAYEQLRRYFELDRPLAVQYGLWLERLFSGDFGHSFHDGERVSAKISRALLPTVTVTLLALFFALLVAVPAGILSAVRRDGLFDRVSSTLFYVLYSVPSYVLGMVLILYLGVKWDLLPFRGMRSDDFERLSPLGKLWDYARHYAMITLCFGLGSLAYYSRFVRQNLLEVIDQDYVRAARAKGLGEARVILKHAFVNSLIPFITLVGLTLPAILSGSVILETMFNWPGLGNLFIVSVAKRDYPTLMALNFVTALLVLAGTLLADLAYGLVDPRVRYE